MLFIFILDEGAHPIAIYGKARQRLLGNINLSVQFHQKNELPVLLNPNINVTALVSCQIEFLEIFYHSSNYDVWIAMFWKINLG